MRKDIISLTDFKNDASSWIERLQNEPPIVLTQNGEGRAVVQSYESYRQTQFAMALLQRAVQAQADRQEGRTLTHGRAMAEVRARIESRLTPVAKPKRARSRG